MGNIRSIRYVDGTEARFEYDLLGRVVSATNEAGEVRLDRDDRGRVVRERQGAAWVARGYDGMGNLEDLRTSLGLAVRTRHDALKQLRELQVLERSGSGHLGASWSVGFGRDLLGREITRDAPGAMGPLRSTRTFGPTAMPMAHTTSRGAVELASVQYAWDEGDRLFAMRRGGREVSFDHDARGRLVAARGPAGTQHRAAGPTGNLARSEGGVGRRHGKGGVLLEAEGTRFGYDARGNTIRKETADGAVWEYAWNGDGTLARVDMPTGSVSFRYDALGRRVEKRVGDVVTRYVWDGNVPLHEVRTGASESPEITSWVYEPGTFAPAAKIGADGKRYSVVSDYLGTPTEMYDEAGALAWQAQLDIFGVARASVGAKGDCPFRWPGQYEDEETGLYWNRFRYYDPERGGYLSKDPIGLRGGLEPYGYVWDPLGETDVFGLAKDCSAANAQKGLDLENDVEKELKANGIPYKRGQHFVSPIPNMSGEIDFEVPNALIEVTVRKKDKLGQLTKYFTPLFNPNGKPVILYAEKYGGAASRDVERTGALVVRTLADLIALVK